jgi:hypothetical protein
MRKSLFDLGQRLGGLAKGYSQHLQHTVWRKSLFPLGQRLLNGRQEFAKKLTMLGGLAKKNQTKIFKNGLQSLKRARKWTSFSPVVGMGGLGYGLGSNVPDAFGRYQLELKKIEASEIKQGSIQNNEPTIPADFNTSSPSRTGCNNASH